MKNVKSWVAIILVVVLFAVVYSEDSADDGQTRQTAHTASTRVAVSGESFGIKMYTAGVLVVGLAPVQTKLGEVNPAADAGVKIGDVIKSIDSNAVNTSQQVSNAFENFDGKKIRLKLERGDRTINVSVTPVKSVITGTYKVGLWVRDSTAGIGTITYYDTSGNFAALGHGINDVDTNTLMPLGNGEALRSKIIGLTKSEKGVAGELYGVLEENVLGKIKLNCENGLYGTVDKPDAKMSFIEVARTEEVSVGKAQIATTVDSSGVRYYDIEILRVNKYSKGTKDMVVKITDERLIEKTGGIVQGMSGSPIVQNGKFVGALTHVFVNKPDKGYAVLAKNMLKYTNSLK